MDQSNSILVLAPYFDLARIQQLLRRCEDDKKYELFTDTYFDESELAVEKLKSSDELIYVLTPECEYSSDYRIMLMITQPYVNLSYAWFFPVGGVLISESRWDGLDFLRALPVGPPELLKLNT